MNDSKMESMDNVDSLDRITAITRKPETRTPFSDHLIKSIHEYTQDIINNLSRGQQQFLQDNSIVILPFGSALRGTASELTSDLDILVLVDIENIPDWLNHLFDGEYHSKKMQLGEYILATHPESTRVINERANRISTMWMAQRRQRGETDLETISDLENKHPETRKYHWELAKSIRVESPTIRVPKSIEAISQGNLEQLRDIDIANDIDSYQIIPALLTTPQQMVTEAKHDSLLYHQKNMVEALKKFKENSPQNFDRFWKKIQEHFSKALTYTQIKKPEYAKDLLRGYVQKSGRFEGKTEQATRLLGNIQKTLSLPSFEEIKQHFKID